MAAAAELPSGQIIERVRCDADASQSYALYLPLSWDRTTPAPVLFCFEPGARGKLPVERFQAGAEKFGYIVASSNNSRNGPLEPQRGAAYAMLTDVFARFAIDRTQIVFTGMSGGARLALTVAQQTGLAHAVIACGAGFPRGQEPANPGFLLLGIVGVDDFNFFELRRVDATLCETEATHRLLVFPGGHTWPPSEIATAALEWIELQAIRAGERERDDAWLADLWQRRLAIAESMLPADRIVEWSGIVRDFDGLADVAPIHAWLDDLARSHEGRALVRGERDEARRQEEALAELVKLARERKLTELRQRAATWQQASAAPTDTSDRRVARRIIGDAATFGREAGQEAMSRGFYRDAIPLFELCAAFRPERAPVWVDLARVYAGSGDARRALAALQHAAENGFSDAARIEAAAEFQSLHSDAAFQAVLAVFRRNRGNEQ